EFASLLRSSDETMAVIEVGSGSELVGVTIDTIDAALVAVRPATGPIEPLPRRSRELAAGDTIYAIARPETLRQLEVRASADASAKAATGADTGAEKSDAENEADTAGG
ncbi:MAG: TrkA C-terminal domain-containing protein, partial [Haloferacaceae archaeon]